jgi:hypothetical protein
MKRLAIGVSLIAALALPSVVLATGALATAALPLGKYTAKVKTPANLKGTWVLNFMKGGKYAISDNGAVVVRGHFTSTSRIYLSGETGPAACPQLGVYSWKRAGKTLKFTKVSDPCVGRATVLKLAFTATG